MDLLCSRLCIRSYIDMSLSFKSYEELERASERWADWHKKVIILDEGRKATYRSEERRVGKESKLRWLLQN